MLLGLLADIHANREALEACLAEGRARGVQEFVFLGDYVGYGADPEWVVRTVMELVGSGSRALLGNHDAAVVSTVNGLHDGAEDSIAWTRNELGREERAFLASLPLKIEESGRLFVHAEAVTPNRWTYVRDASDAVRSMRATACRATFCGHVHRPALYSMSEMWDDVSEMWRATPFKPATAVRIPLMRQRRWLAVLGSVGQPRDGNPAAAWGVLDTELNEIAFMRTPYDVERAAAKILEAGLPEVFAERLSVGR
jgi:diadenosine tetraphosphatase ApaH/serine/threonine PP2A family protein phosphatase